MRLFRSKPKENYKESADKPRQQIEQKLAECTTQLKEADTEMSRLSLAAFQTGDAAAALAVLDKLRAFENQRDLLVAALVECTRQEQERQKELRAQQNQSARRAFSQHAGRFARDTADVAKALVALHDAQERMQASGASIVALLPGHLRCPAMPIHELLGAQSIADQIACEAYRIGDRKGRKPRGLQEDYRTGHIKPLVDILSALCSAIREGFDSAPPPTKPPLPVSSPSASSPPADSGNDAGPLPPSLPAGVDLAAPPDRAAPSEPLRGVAVSLRGGQQTLVELTEPFVPSAGEEASAGEPAEPPVRSVTVDSHPEAEPATGKALTTEGIDFTPPIWRQPMSEEDAGRIEYERQQGQISPGSLDWYRDRLNDPAFARDWPEQHAALQASVDRALAASQQTLELPTDSRSDAAAEHDRRYGVTMVSGVPQLPSDLSNAVTREAESDPADPHEVAQALTNIGRNYRSDYEAAARLLQQIGSKADASKLSAATLANLAIFSDHLARHATGRPQ
jgi:hypothetical protein